MDQVDPRRVRREQAIKALFSIPFGPPAQTDNKIVNQILIHLQTIDNLIAAAAPEWTLNKINKVDLSILRLSVWELVVSQDAPPKVVINEAVELAKKYGSENSPSFINGVLGTILRKSNHQKSSSS